MSDLIAHLESAGLTVERTKGGHVKIHTGQGYVIVPSTASDPRGVKNAVSELRRKGVDI